MAERRKQAKLERDGNVEPLPILREVGGVEHVPSVCMTLRMARERIGHDVKDVAGVLRIKASHLEALEAGRYKDLPGPTYVSGFLRTYADYLGLDRDEILARYREEIGLGSRQKLTFPTPNYERRVPRGWLIIAGLVVAGVAYGGWHYYSTQHSAPSAIVAEVPSDAKTDPKLAAGANLASERASADKSAASGKAVANAQPKPEDAAAAKPARNLLAADDKPASSTGGGAGSSLFDSKPARDAGASAGAASVADSTPSADTTRRNGNLFDGRSPQPSATAAAAGAAGLTAEASAAPSESKPESTTVARLDVPAVAEDTTAAPTPAPIAANEPLPPPTEADIAVLEGGTTEVVPTEADAEPMQTTALAEPADEPAAAPAEPAAVVPSVAEARIVINAKADSWVQIQGPGNELVMTQILRPGETYTVPDRPGLVMVTGNAGGLEVVVDGQPMRSLGPLGVVKRNITLDPDKLRSTYGR